MSAELSELQQRLANMIRVGKVAEVDLETARVRISFGKDAVNKSGWVPWMTARAGATREWNPPAVGEQVVLLNPSGQDNTGVALPGGIYRNDAPANGSEAGHIELDLPSGGKWIIRIGNLTLTAANGTFKAQIGGATFELTPSKMTWNQDVEITGDVAVTGGVTATDDVVAGTISLKTHRHGGVQSGGSNTSTPI